MQILVSLGYVSLDVQYIDGTKIEARSNHYTFVWRKTVEKNKAKLEQAENAECLPTKFDSEALREKLAVLNKQLQRVPSKQVARELSELQAKHLPKLAEYDQHLENLGIGIRIARQMWTLLLCG